MLSLIDVRNDSKLDNFEDFESMQAWVRANRILPGRYCVIGTFDRQVEEVFFVDIVDEVGEDQITFNGIPFEEFAESSQIKGSVRIDDLLFGSFTIWRKWQLIQLFDSLKPGVEVQIRLEGDKFFKVQYHPGQKDLMLYRCGHSY